MSDVKEPIVEYEEEFIGIHPASNPKCRQKERDELARLMAEWEAKNGPVVTSPIGEFHNPVKLTIQSKKAKAKREELEDDE